MPWPWLVELEDCASTNTWLLERLGDMAPGCAVMARRQTAGRGRDGRSWISGEGALTLSMVVAVAARVAPAMALVSGLAVIHAIEEAVPALRASLRIKWPNDVRTPRGKLAGILCETSPSVRDRLVVGIGCNLRNPVTDVAGADSLIAHTADAPEPVHIVPRLRELLIEGAALVQARGLTPLLAELRQRDALLGAALSVQRRDGTVVGHGAGIDDDGRLLVMTRGGVVAVDAGHVVPG